MDTKTLICAVIIFCGFLEGEAESTSAEFSDVWTQELQTSYETCRGRLPPSINADGLKWTTSPRNWYIKYWDQISFFRVINVLLEGHTERPLSELRCLFESPCLLGNIWETPDGFINATYTACNGGKVRMRSKETADGIFDSVYYYSNGTAALTAIFVPALSDYKTFTVHISCLPDGSYGFQVYTTKPALSAYTRHIIKDFLENSGFKDSFRISTSYLSTGCKKHRLD